MLIHKNYSLKNLNTLGIESKAAVYVEAFSEEVINKVLTELEFTQMEKFILGGGSNVLFTNDFPGLILKVSIPGIKVINEEDDFTDVEAGAGVIWNDLVKYCIEKNLGGIENLSLIPGTVGAAPIQNIGAYGQELKDTFISLSGISIDNPQKKEFKKEGCKFSYRDSIFKNELKNKFIVTHVRLRLNKNPEVNLNYTPVKNEINRLGLKNPSIKDVSDIIIKIRKEKLPDPAKIGNAGSFFKNPEIKLEKYADLMKKYFDMPGYTNENIVKIPAAWLIEKCGWKGKKFGNAGVHEKQPLVIVNLGNASGQEILKLANEIKKSVLIEFGIELSEEVNLL